MGYCYVTEWHAYDFVIKDFIIKKGHYLCRTPYVLHVDLSASLFELIGSQYRHTSLYCTSQMLHFYKTEAKPFTSNKRWHLAWLLWSGTEPEGTRGKPVTGATGWLRTVLLCCCSGSIQYCRVEGGDGQWALRSVVLG